MQVHLQQLLPGRSVVSIEVAADIAEKDNAASRRCPATKNGEVGLYAPLPLACFRLTGVQPAGPFARRVIFPPNVQRIFRLHTRPDITVLYGFYLRAGLRDDREAMLHLTGEHQVVLRIVSGAVPFSAANRARADVFLLVGGETRVRILHASDGNLVRNARRRHVDPIQVAILWSLEQHLFARLRFHDRWRRIHIPIVPIVVPIVRHKRPMASIRASFCIKRD